MRHDKLTTYHREYIKQNYHNISIKKMSRILHIPYSRVHEWMIDEGLHNQHSRTTKIKVTQNPTDTFDWDLFKEDKILKSLEHIYPKSKANDLTFDMSSYYSIHSIGNLVLLDKNTSFNKPCHILLLWSSSLQFTRQITFTRILCI